MNVTGVRIREALNKWTVQRDMASQIFPKIMYQFEGEQKESPDSVMQRLEKAEKSIARLQAAQDAYNLAIKVNFNGSTISLAEAINLLGSYGRRVKLWNTALIPESGVGRYYRENPLTRQKDSEVAKPQLTDDVMRDRVVIANSEYQALKRAIAEGNTTECVIDWLSQELLD